MLEFNAKGRLKINNLQFTSIAHNEDHLQPKIGYYDKIQNRDFGPTHQTGGA